MEKIRNSLPLILEGAGVAVALLFSLTAAVSLDDPLTAVVLFAVGIAIGGVVAGFGGLLRASLEATRKMRHVHQDVRSLGNACMRILQDASKEEES